MEILTSIDLSSFVKLNLEFSFFTNLFTKASKVEHDVVNLRLLSNFGYNKLSMIYLPTNLKSSLVNQFFNSEVYSFSICCYVNPKNILDVFNTFSSL